jgi:type II secretory pathway pseudopilin PulG
MNTGSNKGYTLVELIVAAVIIALSVITVVIVIRVGANLTAESNERRAARSLIQGRFERDYNLWKYNEILPTENPVEEIITDDPAFPNGAKLSTTVTEATVADVPVKKIAATLEWYADDGTTRRGVLSLSKTIANVGSKSP